MATRKRNKIQREHDLEFIARLYCQGFTQREIADRLAAIQPYRLTQQQISRDMKEIRALWRDSTLRNFDEAKAQELAKIDNLEAVNWEAFDRSVGEMRKRIIEDRSGEDGYTSERTMTWEEAGDPRFLQGVQKCIEMRCKLLGLVTEKFEGTVSGGGAPLLVQIVAAATANVEGDE